MALAFVQVNQTWPTTSATTTALAYSSNVTAGSLLWCIVYWNNTGVTCTVADGVNGSWTGIGTATVGAGGLASFIGKMFYFPNAGAGATTVAATFSSAVTRRGIAIHEYSGADTSSPLDQSAYVAVNSTGATTPTITTTNANDVIVAGCLAGTTTTGAAGGYTSRATPGAWSGNETEDQIVSATGTYGPNFTEGVANDNLVGIAAFKQASAGAAVVNTLALLGVGT